MNSWSCHSMLIGYECITNACLQFLLPSVKPIKIRKDKIVKSLLFAEIRK